jgi:hypothetical protein
MKKLLFLAVLLSSLTASAQRVNSCGFKIPPPLPFQQFQSVYEARDVIKRMLDSIAWQENFSIREENGSNNAYATVIRGKRWIIYDNDFLERLDYAAKTKQASVSVLAHEIGHHYYNHVVDGRGSTPPKEIQADYFSGVVMAKLGVTLNDAVAAMQNVASDRASATHPAKSDRVAAITKGWNAAMKYADSVKKAQGGNTGGQSGGQTGGQSGGQSGGQVGGQGTGQTGGQSGSNNVNDGTWIHLWHYEERPVTVYLSDDGKRYDRVDVPVGQAFIFKYEIYKYGWVRVAALNGQYNTYKLDHGKDYALLYSRKRKHYIVTEVQ